MVNRYSEKDKPSCSSLKTPSVCHAKMVAVQNLCYWHAGWETEKGLVAEKTTCDNVEILKIHPESTKTNFGDCLKECNSNGRCSHFLFTTLETKKTGKPQCVRLTKIQACKQTPDTTVLYSLYNAMTKPIEYPTTDLNKCTH